MRVGKEKGERMKGQGSGGEEEEEERVIHDDESGEGRPQREGEGK